MKRILTSLLLAVYILTSLVIFPAKAAGGVAVCSDNQQVVYADFQSAVNACRNGQYLKILANTTVNITMQKDLYVDLNGYNLTGQIQPNSYQFYGFDSATDNYTSTGGTFSCTGVTPARVSTGNNNRYLAISTDQGWQFHRFYAGITHTSLDTATCGIGFKAQFWGSDAVMNQLSGRPLEYRLQLEDYSPRTIFISKDQLYSGRTISLRINHWDVENYAYDVLYAWVRLNLADGTTIDSAKITSTFRDTVGYIDSHADSFTWEQLKNVATLIDLHPVMSRWGLQNIPPQCRQHTDTDSNGYCDRCTESVTVSFNVYAINDLHGKFNDGDNHIGVDKFTTYIKNARQKGNVILLSSGDMWQGGAESNLTKGQIVTDWMNQIGFDAMTMGNHEYDWARAPIEANAELANFPFLGINIYDKSTDNRVSYCDSSVMVDFGDLQVGIIGAIGNCYSSIASGQADDVYFKTGSQLTNLVKAESQKLRQQGADFIIYSLHDGYEDYNTGTSATSVTSLDYYDVALSNGYVDLVFEGHTHQRYLLRDQYGVYHIQGGGDNSGFSQASVTVNTVTGKSTVSNAQSLKTSTYSSLSPDPLIADLLEKYKDLIRPAYEELGYNARQRSSAQICTWVSQLYLKAGLEKWGSQYNIYLAGGSISCRSPYKLYKGQVKYEDLMTILPFDNEIVLCKIPGNKLLTRFINNSDYVITRSDYGNATPPVNNSLNYYYVITDTFTANYAPNNMTIIDTLGPNIFARDLLAEYIRQGNLAK
ncbi:MAG: bifunctional metallophosphatase/5'-nucleotidase [Oscillospiraceae bacterium]|nr:bifunctional metallophosphatase/5'-nucleotidase [Oscillospiraceae bacterium]